MTLTEFVTSPAYKKFMGYVYGFGAAVAIIGALFKILHLPGASVMLVCGLGVEAIIFALSSFEPPHETPDWSLVYPELAGLEPADGGSRKRNGGNGGNGGSELSALVASGAVDQKTVDQLADGVKKLATTTSQLSDITDASVATKSYLNNVKSAADSLNQFSAAQSSVSEAGSKLAAKMNEEGDKFATSFTKFNNAFASQSDAASKLGNNMSAVSQAYEQQSVSIYCAMSCTLRSMRSESRPRLVAMAVEMPDSCICLRVSATCRNRVTVRSLIGVNSRR